MFEIVDRTSTLNEDGVMIERLDVEGADFDQITVEQREDSLEVFVDGDQTYSFEYASGVYRGVTTGDTVRRDISEDIQDALLIAGYAALGGFHDVEGEEDA